MAPALHNHPTMQRPAHLHRRLRKAALVGVTLLATLAVPSPEAAAAPPTEADFQIYYFITNRDGSRGRQMTQQDMVDFAFINRARCECGQKIITRVTFQGGAVDQDQVNAYVGQNCADAQANAGIGNFAPCAQLTSATPQAFQSGPEYAFDPIFLAYGVTGDQGISVAEPAGNCEGGVEGEGGLWMCSGVNTCQMGDFFMTGMANINVPGMGIRYDFQPPVNPPTNFAVSAGDQAVNITWEVTAVPESGYRVLCADENGNPIGSPHAAELEEQREAVSIMNGTVYFTPDNICPDGVFGEDNYGEGATGDGDGDATGDGDGDMATGDGDGDMATGDGDGDTTTGDGDGDMATGDGDGDCGGLAGCACVTDEDCAADELLCVDEICQLEGCATGELGCACDAEGGCADGLECDNDFCVEPAVGIETLDWSYVCSPHLGFNNREARIEGLENGKTYQFVVVAYDRAGNAVASEVISGTPTETRGLWEECEAAGNICGEGWNCSVQDDTPRSLGWMFGALGLLGLGCGIGLRRRRRA